MHWPQITYICISAVGLLLTARDDGKPRSPESLMRTLIAVAIAFFLLIEGGFFSH